MSKARICDRCGKVCKSISGMIKMEMSSYISMDTVSGTQGKSLDLCEQCFEEFGVWASEIFLKEAADEQSTEM